MANITWNDSKFRKNIKEKGVDGLEEWGRTVWHPQAYKDAPKKTSAMAGSLRVERGPDCIFCGGGGQAKDYILKQELDRSLHHEVGKAGFIGDTVQQNISKLPTYVKKHVG